MTDEARAGEPRPSTEAVLEQWAERFLTGLSFNEPALQQAEWAKRRAPDVAASILAAIEREAAAAPALDVERLAEWLHHNAATRRRITCGPDSKGCRTAHRLDAMELIEYARLSEKAP